MPHRQQCCSDWNWQAWAWLLNFVDSCSLLSDLLTVPTVLGYWCGLKLSDRRKWVADTSRDPSIPIVERLRYPQLVQFALQVTSLTRRLFRSLCSWMSLEHFGLLHQFGVLLCCVMLNYYMKDRRLNQARPPKHHKRPPLPWGLSQVSSRWTRRGLGHEGC